MKTINAFIIHVNADYPEHVDHAFKLAVEYRTKFNRDVMIDINGYRRLGHNEHDSPKFTQPKVYNTVDVHPKLITIYSKQLISEGVIKQEDIDKMYNQHMERLTKAYENAKQKQYLDDERKPTLWKPYLGKWTECKNPAGPPTSISEADFKRVGRLSCDLAKDHELHPLADKAYEARLKSFETGTGLDWATAEQLAFGSLLDAGYGVRLSGEDVKRGTFSHRHAVVFDQRHAGQFAPLSRLAKGQAQGYTFQIFNSFLSEYGVMGFDYGYSLGSPNYLTLWEAQFGDFSNCAQPIIDLYIANGEVKWGLKSGLVLLLPHGLDGQGPEHSSCRVERYLQLVDDDFYDPQFIKDDDLQSRLCNFAVVNITEPANYFHVLRRQLLRDFRKPLIVLAPKRLLRLKEVGTSADRRPRTT